MHTHKCGRLPMLLPALLLAGLWLVWASGPLHAAGVVGDGTPGSCTDAAYAAAFTGGGLVTFDCGPNPHTIVVNTQVITGSTTVDGGGLVTLDGENLRQLFLVLEDGNLTLQEITLARAISPKGRSPLSPRKARCASIQSSCAIRQRTVRTVTAARCRTAARCWSKAPPFCATMPMTAAGPSTTTAGRRPSAAARLSATRRSTAGHQQRCRQPGHQRLAGAIEHSGQPGRRPVRHRRRGGGHQRDFGPQRCLSAAASTARTTP